MMRERDERVYGLMARFEHEDALCDAAWAARDAGYRRLEAYSPFPVDGLAEAVGFRPRLGMSWVVVAGLAAGAMAGFALQYYAFVWAYPINVGGRPLTSWPAFILVTFEVAILVAAFAAVAGMFALNRLPRWRHPVLRSPQFSQAMQDSFFLVIESSDPQFSVEDTRRFLWDLAPREVIAVER
ncbi:MAG TPA: DUF3341 domain-containing protein [Candidatus Sulfomarinibacteraceae bacterium]|nr:DUF3341 domain-containing protein [Candidatus Sulfomarinibacteraceae bacterium]